MNIRDRVEATVHNLWINAELFQHQVDKIHAVDMRRPDQRKAEATQAILDLIEQTCMKVIGDNETSSYTNEVKATQRQHLKQLMGGK